jgi:hypothetical protein
MHIEEATQQGSTAVIKQYTYHPVIRTAARVVSVVFHPLFIPVYITAFVLYYTPVFPGFAPEDKGLLLVRFAVMYTLFPLVTVLLAKGLGFIQTIYLSTQKDRIIPYVACGLYYFWMWYVLKNQPEFPREMVMLALAIFLVSSGGLVLNSYMKVSMHALSLGVMITFVYLLSLAVDANLGFYISIATLITGLVCTARLINSDHHPVEVYAGLALGIVGQMIAYWITF